MNWTGISTTVENCQLTNETCNTTGSFQISREASNITGSFQIPRMSQGRPTVEGYNVLSEEIVTLIKKVSYLGICPTLIIGGLVSNIICLVLFCKLIRKTKTSTVILLLTMSITDILYNIMAGFNSLFVASSFYDVPFTVEQRTQAVPYFYSFVRPLPGRFGAMLTLIISLERLFCVLQPIKIRQYSTRKNALIVVLILFILAVTVTSPLILINRPIQIYSNFTRSFIYIIVPTELGKDVQLIDTLYLLAETLFGFIPLFGVCVASSLTVVIVIVSARRRSKMTTMTKNQNNEMNVTRTLLALTFLFIICKSPATLLGLIIFINMKPYQYTSNVYDVAMAVTYIPLLLNAVLNLVIYYKTSSAYKAKIQEMFGCSKPQKANITTPKQLTIENVQKTSRLTETQDMSKKDT